MKQIRVNIADYAVSAGKVTIATIGLGSCVAIVLHDVRAGIGALAHVLLPNEALSSRQDSPGKFAATALPAMISRMHELGAKNEIAARLIGGASMFASLIPNSGPSLGSRNIVAARAACAANGVPVVGEDVGGSHGRSVYFDVKVGSVLVRSLAVGDVTL
ncbi:MAG: chemotaxis protein CheD [Gemmatimonadaceae bacterium]